MKKLILSCLVALALLFGGMSRAQADQYLRVGMEAAYAPFNWTQDDASNGAVPIEGTSQYANGYDVQVAKKIAKAMNKELLVVKTSWTGLIPALTSGKIDMIAAGMSPTDERRKEITFSNSYYTSEPVLVVAANGKYAGATSLDDFANAKVTAQQGVWHVNLLTQLKDAKLQTPMGDFSQMRQALSSGVIDAYISERPEAMTAEAADSHFKMITLKKGFTVSESDAAIAVGMKKNDNRIAIVNQVLEGFSQTDRMALMDDMITKQPMEKKAEDAKPSFLGQMWAIFRGNWKQFLRGTGMTLLISMVGTITGLFIGLLIGIFRTAPKAKHKVAALGQKLFGWLLNIYIEIFRGTPMIVQSMVIYYGTAQAFGISIDRTLAAIFIVSINTGAYMSEIVRGGIFAVDKGQFEAATALGFTHGQTMRKIVLPQVVRNILPATGNEFVINIKDTSVLNVISVVELYFSGNTVATQTYQYFQTFTIIAIIYFVLTFTVTRILRYIERRFDADTYTTGANQMQVAEVPNV
ncbi:ABC transporter substrate-binding protein/permease [Streptococcus dysgalactiae]|uniref:Amino acid ABC transporter substrate-binding protein n=1 Tax=Streptococcus dysgalactiae TaxID=1334 RepID=A0A9X9QN96_STRDY|nr:ABC transporter substrate-binding protein/permease [Streptococcus dysgalactiae]MDY2963049.1 ABC transporter substrate-binding protein/permease [Streptococcus dysgalactiae]MDY4035245.1 ABC transporter substrate-binding protein/permease [Streptococcus dysgalactiae]MEC4578523.1 ABC transporter substrate-binding protein/permease [Streptococcus dysgalactiae]VTS21584.1 amino acid ABC transporter substrate-binding protein [Streptococcus dysgalactiae subsp. equisimilis]VTS43148.1 amino acid ABC tra